MIVQVGLTARYVSDCGAEDDSGQWLTAFIGDREDHRIILFNNPFDWLLLTAVFDDLINTGQSVAIRGHGQQEGVLTISRGKLFEAEVVHQKAVAGQQGIVSATPRLQRRKRIFREPFRRANIAATALSEQHNAPMSGAKPLTRMSLKLPLCVKDDRHSDFLMAEQQEQGNMLNHPRFSQ